MLEQIVTALAGIAFTAISLAIPLVVPLALKRWTSAINADQADALERGLQAAAGVAYNAAIRAGGLHSAAVRTIAVAEGADYAGLRFADTLDRLGKPPEEVARMVDARLGVLLAHDPNVTVGQPPPGAAIVPLHPVMPSMA